MNIKISSDCRQIDFIISELKAEVGIGGRMLKKTIPHACVRANIFTL